MIKIFFFIILTVPLNSRNIGRIPKVLPPLVEKLDAGLIMKELRKGNGSDNRLRFMLGVAYLNDEKYPEAFRVLRNIKKIRYLEDYIKYYQGLAVFNTFNRIEKLQKARDCFYSLLSKGRGNIISKVKEALPGCEFKLAKTLAVNKRYSSSIEHLVRARDRGYSDLESEFYLVKLYLKYNRKLALGFFLDLYRRFGMEDVKPYFNKLPKKIRKELFSAVKEVDSKEVTPSLCDFCEVEHSLLSSIKKATQTASYSKFRSLVEQYLESYPGGFYNREFYKLATSFIGDAVLKGARRASYFEDILDYYDRDFLKELLLKFWGDDLWHDVELVLNIITRRFPADAGGFYLTASMYEDKGDAKTAIKYYRRVIKGFPRSRYYGRALFKYAWIEMLRHNYKSCVDIYSRYLKEGGDKDSWDITGALYFKSKCLGKVFKEEEAREVIDKLYAQYPYSFYALISRDERNLSLVKDIQERTNMSSAGELGAVSPQELYTLHTALNLIRVGLVDDAAKELLLLNLAELSPTYVEIIANLYRYSTHPNMAVVAAYRLRNEYKGYISRWHAESHFPLLYLNYIDLFSKSLGIEPFLVLSIIKRESAFKEDAVSRAGALGLMQIMPHVAASINPKVKSESLKVAGENIKVASMHLKELLEKSNGNFVHTLCSYNAGEKALERWLRWYDGKLSDIEFIEAIPYPETRQYVKSVIANYYMYNALYRKRDVRLEDVLKLVELDG